MKRIANLVLLSLLLSSQVMNAQVVMAALDHDPVFNQVVTHRIHYPAKPATQAVYGRFYAGFRIDEKGHIQDITILYPKMSTRISKQYGFETEIVNGLKRLPPLKPTLAGSYRLPVAFCFTNYREGPTPILPTNTLPASLVTGDRIGLQEVKVYASSPSSGWLLKGFPSSRQIGQQVSL